MKHAALVLAFAAAVLAGAAGCDEPRRVPYIKPDLAGWERPYAGVDGLVLHVFETGVVRVPAALLAAGGNPTESRTLPVAAYVLSHPTEGLVVIGTGLDDAPATLAPPGAGMLATLLAAEARSSRTLADQMRDANLDPAAVRRVLLPTLLPQHAGGLDAFPAATVVVARSEQNHALRAPTAYRSDDFAGVETWKLLEFDGPGLGTFAAAADVLGDGSVMALEAPGWSAGAMVFLVRLPQRPVLLAAGLAETGAHFRYAAQPNAIHDIDAWWQHIWELKRFADLAPELLVVPGAEPRVLEAVAAPDVVFHAAPEVVEPVPTRTPDAMRRMFP